MLMVDYKAIGRRISYYRKKKGLTQAAFAESLGVSESYVSQIERGISRISLARLYEVADVLKTDIVFLISDELPYKGFDCTVNSEIFEITKSWSKEKIALLIKLLLCVADNNRDKENEKHKA